MDQTDKKDQHTSSEDNQVSQNPRKSSAQELQNDQNGEEVKPSDIVVDAPEVVPPENEPPRIFGKEIKKSASVKQLSSSESNLLCLAQLYVLAIYIAGFVFDVKLAKYHFSDVDIKSYSAMIGSYITAAENLNTKPILDIKVSATMSCPTGYTLSHLGGWPGSENGCYCEDIEEQITSCGDECGDIPARSGFDLDFFTKANEYLCVQRAQPNIDFKYQRSCDFGSTQCFPGYCSLTGNCPITNVTFDSSAKSSRNVFYQDNYLNFYSDMGKLPLININISYYGMPCFDYYSNSATPNKSYILLSRQPDGCGVHGFDENAVFLASAQEEIVLATNNAVTKTNLPKYSQFTPNIPIDLIARYRIESLNSDDCRSANINVFVYDSGNKIKHLNLVLTIAVIIELILLGFGSCCIFGLCGGFFKYETDNLTRIRMVLGKGVSVFFQFIVWVICAPIANGDINIMQQSETFIQDQSYCFTSASSLLAFKKYDPSLNQIGEQLRSYVFSLLWIKVALVAPFLMLALASAIRKSNK